MYDFDTRWQLLKETRDQLSQALENSFDEILKALRLPQESTGGVLRMFVALKPEDGFRGWHQVLQRRIGNREDKFAWEKAEMTSMEKFIRLARNHAIKGLENITSWDGRNPVIWKYGGAVIIRANIKEFGGGALILLSFSGLPEIGDETLVLRLADRMGWKDTQNVRKIIFMSQNYLYTALPAVS
jgi:hypothetical protein